MNKPEQHEKLRLAINEKNSTGNVKNYYTELL